jgi:DNA polymerase elongation subunit (family B)
VCCFGYLGYKNARFGRVEAHEAVTAFGRDKLFKAVDVAEKVGYEVLHGIVDSLWLKRTDAREEDYRELCGRIEERSGLPISLEGIYKWIIFLPSKMYPEVPVLNRYFGVFENGEIKARGIELRRSDTPGIVKNAQLEMLQVLSEAADLEGYLGRLSECVSIINSYAEALRKGDVAGEDLIISRRASKAPWEYANLSHIAVSSLKLHKAGKTVRPGQFIGYVITKASSKNPWERAEPVEFYEEGSNYDWRRYTEEIIRAGTTLFEGLGPTRESMRRMVLDGRRQANLLEIEGT